MSAPLPPDPALLAQYWFNPTYGTLKTELVAWADRTDLADKAPMFVRAAHDTVVSDVLMGLEADSSSYVEAPYYVRRVASVWIDRCPKRPLVLADEHQMTGLGTGVPVFYRTATPTILGPSEISNPPAFNVVFAPTPDRSYRFKLLYKVTRTFFSSDDATNSVMTRYPLVYLYAARKSLAIYLHDAEAAAGFDALYRDEVDRINRAELGDSTVGGLQMTPSSGATP